MADDFVPDPTHQSGTLDTSGIGGPSHGDLKTITTVFDDPSTPEIEGPPAPEDPAMAEVAEEINTQTADTSGAGSPENPMGPDSGGDVEDLESMTKAELIDLAREQGLDTSGTKADLIDRLQG